MTLSRVIIFSTINVLPDCLKRKKLQISRHVLTHRFKEKSAWKVKEKKKKHLLTELLDRAPPLYEVLKEVMLSLQVTWSEQPQVHHHVVRHVLIVEGAQHLFQTWLFLTQFDQVHELGGKDINCIIKIICASPVCQFATQLMNSSASDCSRWADTSTLCTLGHFSVQSNKQITVKINDII